MLISKLLIFDIFSLKSLKAILLLLMLVVVKSANVSNMLDDVGWHILDESQLCKKYGT